jgi:hypothetical protein
MSDLHEVFEKAKQKEEEERIEREKLEKKEMPIVSGYVPGFFPFECEHC